MIYKICQYTALIILKLFFRLRVTGAGNIPSSGPAIIAANHASFLDPPIIATSIRRSIYFMARKSLFRIWGFGWLIRQTHAFPVKRGGFDTSGLKRLFDLIEKGNIVLLFPEGTRSHDGLLQQPHSGAGMVAYRKRVPIIPALIKGSYSALPRTTNMVKFYPLSVKFGVPVRLDEFWGREKGKKTYQDISRKIMQAISEMDS
ncbi:MAG: lysophospholipid acyltransferase family protein [bacterium]